MMFKRSHITGCLLALLWAVPAAAQSSITLAWDANTEPDVAGYTVSWGTTAGVYTASVDVGNQTEWTFSAPDPDQRYFFVVQAYNSQQQYSAPSSPVSNNAIITRTPGTLIDQRPGIFWHNQSTGELMSWHLSGSNIIDTRAISMVASDTDWKVAGVGDLNGDSYSDILWRHEPSGQMAVWYLQNNQVIFTGRLSINTADRTWRIAGLGDANADGHADILWQHTDGWLAVWFMQGTNVLSTQYLTINRMTNPFWSIAAVGDINRDGTADIVWQGTDGALATWTLRGTRVTTTQYLSIRQMPDVNWRIRAVGRPNGGPTPALVWRHAVDGRVALWYMNGAQVLSTVVTNPTGVDNLDWNIVGSR